MTCFGCQRVARAAAGADPCLIAPLRESMAVLHAHQAYPGWCVLWAREHAEHLHHWPAARQARLWQDVGDVARAIAEFTGCRRLNYENLGNVVAHVHWHVIPRYDPPLDPDPGAPVWTRARTELECGVTDAQRKRLVAGLRERLTLPA